MRWIALALVAWLGVARADSSRERANELFLEGRELLTSKQTAAACEKFEESIALDPRAPGVMLNLGLCYEMLEKYATSLYWFRKAQAASSEAKLPEYEAEAKRHTIELASKVPVVKIDVSDAPADVEIRIDGKLIQATDYARVEIDRGGHNVEARAPGKQPFQRSIVVKGEDAGTLVIPELEDVKVEKREEPVETPTTRSSTITGRDVLAASFGVVGIGLCIASPLWAHKIKSDYEDARAAMEMPSYSGARNQQHIATGMFFVGAGLVGLGTYLYLSRPSGDTGATAVVPVVGPSQVGIALSGSL